ncbi:MAG: DUF72 domain-containing protein [Capsulimonas sp.]|uniref:DUF72 domain-containing protein n=1 Tax=Capsulimonas sp. TaxID=2494211 RepID=UPI003264546F
MSNDPPMSVRIGCAGWSVPKEYAASFPDEGSHLEKYATKLNCAEINSSFYKPHRPSTYERWAASVPDGFQFSVKVPREITHTRKLTDFAEPLAQFLEECGHLGERLGPLLVQLPPSLAYDANLAAPFFEALNAQHNGDVVCEPRHESWFTPEANALLVQYHIARVAADPARTPEAAHPGGWGGVSYYRLHGSPRIYYSAYSEDYLKALAALLAPGDWCIFDNTASGSAIGNALSLMMHALGNNSKN